MQKILIIALLLTPFAKADIVKGVQYVEKGFFLNHTVADITVTNGYVTDVSLVDDTDSVEADYDGTGFVGQAVMSGTSVGKIQVINPGYGYGYAQNLVIGNPWVASTAVSFPAPA